MVICKQPFKEDYKSDKHQNRENRKILGYTEYIEYIYGRIVGN